MIIAIIAGVLLTGAFHEDGFADVCDGFGGGWNKQQILTIMKDSRIGAYGAIGLTLLVVLKIALLSSLSPAAIPGQLLAGHSISRLAPLILMHRYSYAGAIDSKGAAAVFKPQHSDLLFSAGFALAPFMALPIELLWSLLPLYLVIWKLGRYFNDHIEGYTGDCLGASQQITETAYYLSVTALWTFI